MTSLNNFIDMANNLVDPFNAAQLDEESKCQLRAGSLEAYPNVPRGLCFNTQENIGTITSLLLLGFQELPLENSRDIGDRHL